MKDSTGSTILIETKWNVKCISDLILAEMNDRNNRNTLEFKVSCCLIKDLFKFVLIET